MVSSEIVAWIELISFSASANNVLSSEGLTSAAAKGMRNLLSSENCFLTENHFGDTQTYNYYSAEQTRADTMRRNDFARVHGGLNNFPIDLKESEQDLNICGCSVLKPTYKKGRQSDLSTVLTSQYSNISKIPPAWPVRWFN